MTEASTPIASPEAIEIARKLLNLAQRACRAQLRQDWSKLDALENALDETLVPLLLDKTPMQLHETMTVFFEKCGSLADGDAAADLVSVALQQLSESVSDEEGNETHHLFALPMLVPVSGRDWSQRLTEDELQRVDEALQRHGLVAEDALVTWLPLAVPFSYVLDLSEWSVAQVAMHLAKGEVQDAVALVQSLATPVVESSAVPHDLDATVMESRILIGAARIGERIEFPLGAKVMQQLEEVTDERDATAVMEGSRVCLLELARDLEEVLGLSEMQVMAEIQGWWADVGAAHQLMRAVHAQQQLQGLLMQHGLLAQEVLASSDLRAVSDEPIGMEVALFRKAGLQFIGTLRFIAIPSESPDDCANDTMEFLASNGVTVVAAQLLQDSRPQDDEQGPHTLH